MYLGIKERVQRKDVILTEGRVVHMITTNLTYIYMYYINLCRFSMLDVSRIYLLANADI